MIPLYHNNQVYWQKRFSPYGSIRQLSWKKEHFNLVYKTKYSEKKNINSEFEIRNTKGELTLYLWPRPGINLCYILDTVNEIRDIGDFDEISARFWRDSFLFRRNVFVFELSQRNLSSLGEILANLLCRLSKSRRDLIKISPRLMKTQILEILAKSWSNLRDCPAVGPLVVARFDVQFAGENGLNGRLPVFLM